MDDDGSNETPLTSDLLFNIEPDWFPNGRKIVLSRSEDIYAMTLDASGDPTGKPTRLTTNPNADRQPVVSPDGRRIAFASDRDGDFDIYVMKAAPQDGDTNLPRNLTGNAADDSDPAWSPDGETIAFATDRTGDDEIWRMRTDGAEPTNLTKSPNSQDLQPAWQPLP
jgi:TolB protein